MAKKPTVAKSKTTQKPTEKLQASQQNRPNIDKLLKNKKALVIFGIGLLILVSLLFLFKGVFIAATVNGEPISRISVIKELEKQNGKGVLENLITKKLILQEARKRNVEVTDAEIDSEIKNIEENLKTQGTTLDAALKLQGMSKNQLTEEIKTQLSIQKIVGEDMDVTKKEIEEFVTQNKDQFPENITDAQMKKQAKAALKQQKLQEKTQAFLEELQKNANVRNFLSY